MSESGIPDLADSSEDQFQVEEIVDALIKIVSDARTSLRSSSIILNRDEMLSLLNEVREKFPDEIRAARWLIRERRLFIEKVQQEKIEIIEEAQKRASELVSRVEVVREAQKEAQHIVQAAREEAARSRNQLEVYCEKKLTGLEVALENIFETVQRGKAKLQTVSEDSLRDLEVQSRLNFENHDTGHDAAGITEEPAYREPEYNEPEYREPVYEETQQDPLL